MEENNPHVEAFRQEAEELLGDVEESVLDLEENPLDKEAIDRLFRAMHTIKGSGAMFGFDAVSDFTHHLETALDKVRDGRYPVTRELIDLVLSSRDLITRMLEDGREPVSPEEGERIILALGSMMPPSEDEAIVGVQESAPPREEKGESLFRIRFKPDPAIFGAGMDPALLLDELREMGECDIVPYFEELPPFAQMEPESCYLFWDVTLSTVKEADDIRDVFIFVEDMCEISIEIIEASVEMDAEKPVPLLGEILMNRGDVDAGTIEKVMEEKKKLGELLVESGEVSREKINSALAEQKALEKQKTKAKSASVRVASDKLDKLINLVGELVIIQARLSQVATRVDDMELANPVEEVERLTAELRDSVLGVRMMQIGTTFSKFRRLVRDLSSELGKEIELVTVGAETELDKTIVERLDDPLVHLIRNSIDHGIEPPGIRAAAGKSEKGTIRLSAAHRGANVEITIEDDGAGLEADVIRAKAEERGLIQKDADLSGKEIFDQIFSPGFSTSESVTSISGRGVGMDVVKRTIDSLRGSIELDSRKNVGTNVTLRLPLTLAIINGLLVTIGEDYFVLPLMTVEECVELTREDVERSHGSNILNVRGEIVPYIRLREYFGITGDKPVLEHIVITDVNSKRIGFVVDHVIGGYQTVIKSLGPAYSRVKDISGATILGDGTVALILDVNAIV